MHGKSRKRSERRRRSELKRLQRWETARILGWGWSVDEVHRALALAPDCETAMTISRDFGQWRNHHLIGRKRSRRGNSSEDYRKTRQQLRAAIQFQMEL